MKQMTEQHNANHEQIHDKIGKKHSFGASRPRLSRNRNRNVGMKREAIRVAEFRGN